MNKFYMYAAMVREVRVTTRHNKLDQFYKKFTLQCRQTMWVKHVGKTCE